jgi:hypothetical protein
LALAVQLPQKVQTQFIQPLILKAVALEFS